MLPLCRFFCVIFTYLDRSNLSFSALSFKRDLHLNNAQYGLGAGMPCSKFIL